MNNKQVIRLTENQFHQIIKEAIDSIQQIQGENHQISLNYAVEWLIGHVEDYVTYSDTMVMPSMRAGFDIQHFIKDFKTAMLQKV